jgi:hypothetical protein
VDGRRPVDALTADSVAGLLSDVIGIVFSLSRLVLDHFPEVNGTLADILRELKDVGAIFRRNLVRELRLPAQCTDQK